MFLFEKTNVNVLFCVLINVGAGKSYFCILMLMFCLMLVQENQCLCS